MDIIEKNMNLPWKWNLVSHNANITLDFVKKYPDKNWKWSYISHVKNIIIDTFDPDKTYNKYECIILSRCIFYIHYNNLINILNLPEDIKSYIKILIKCYVMF